MASGPWHYKQAENILAEGVPEDEAPGWATTRMIEAQVHATLAAVAVQVDGRDGDPEVADAWVQAVS